MEKMIRSLLCATAMIALTGVAASGASAQNYPSRTIRILVGFPPGGATDVVARLAAAKLAENMGNSIIVENVPGASATIAARRVATAAADGYTLLASSVTDTAQPALRNDLPYDLERDFTAISMLGVGPMALVVNPALPVRNLKELIALARAQPGKLTYGSAGIGSVLHFGGELFNLTAKVSTVHVPYKGASDVVAATASGEIPMSFVILTAALPLIEAGRLRTLGITSLTRWSPAPSIPTLDESGLPGFEIYGWWGIHGPAKLPRAIVDRLNSDISKAVNTTTMKSAFNAQGVEPKTTTPEEFATFFHNDIAMAERLMKLTGANAK